MGRAALLHPVMPLLLLAGALAACDSAPRAATPPEAEAAATPATRVFYQWVDEAGTVRFAEDLDEVPVSWRDRAGRVEVAAAPPRAAAASAPRVVVYTTSWCGWCRRTLAHLDRKGVSYENRDIEADPDASRELLRKTGSTAIPVLEIDGQLLRGYDPHAIDRLLAAAS